MSRMVKKPEVKPAPKVEIMPETKPEIKPLPKNEIQPVQPQPVSVAGSQPVPAAETEPAAAAVDQLQTAEPVQTFDQGQLYQSGQPSIGDEAQVYQYEPIQQTGQFYGEDQGQQYDQSPAIQNGQAQAYMPYQFYQEQPISTYDPYQMYQQPVQTYGQFQAFPGQPAEPVQYQYPGEPAQQPDETAQMMQPDEAAPLQQELEASQMQQPEILKQEQPDTGFVPQAEQAVQSDEMPPQDINMQQVGSEQTQQPQDTNKEPQVKETAREQTLPQSEFKYPVGSGNLDAGCLYLNGNICGAILNNMSETASPCDTCKIHRGEPAGQVQAAGDLSRLKAILDLNFEVSDPFHSKRSDYEWWKITNPVNLNNILYQNNIRSPLMFNPAVMLAHYKYHHLIVGIFTRKDGQKYVVCGVPGMHMVDRKPFGDMSKWVQADGGRSRYGAFGYWLVYINPDDGKILNLNQE